MILTSLEQETIYLRDELRKAAPKDITGWLDFLKAWFETEDKDKGFRQQMRESLKTDHFQYLDRASPSQPSGRFMDFYEKDNKIALAILQEWASILVLKAIPRPTNTQPWNRWVEEVNNDGITTGYQGSDEEFKTYFGGRRFPNHKKTAA